MITKLKWNTKFVIIVARKSKKVDSDYTIWAVLGKIGSSSQVHQRSLKKAKRTRSQKFKLRMFLISINKKYLGRWKSQQVFQKRILMLTKYWLDVMQLSKEVAWLAKCRSRSYWEIINNNHRRHSLMTMIRWYSSNSWMEKMVETVSSAMNLNSNQDLTLAINLHSLELGKLIRRKNRSSLEVMMTWTISHSDHKVAVCSSSIHILLEH